MPRCDFRRTDIDGDGIVTRKWRCSRQAKHDYPDTDSLGRIVGNVCLCTQHLKCAEKFAAEQKERNERYAKGLT